MNILITGVSGFIGHALWDYFKTRDLQAYGVDVQLRRSSPFLFACDLSDPIKLKKILVRVKPDFIFHLAGGRPQDEDLLWEANFIPTKRLLDVIGQIKSIHPCIVIPGSAAEYGKIKMPQKLVDEKVQPQPLAWYGFVKHMQTGLGLMHAAKGVDVRIARIFNIGGYGTPATLALGNFAQKIVQIEKGMTPLLRVGSLSGRRDFLDIEDVCSALWAIARRGRRGQVYNVCSGQSLNMRQLLDKLIRYSEVKNIAVIELPLNKHNFKSPTSVKELQGRFEVGKGKLNKEDKKPTATTFDIAGSNAKIKQLTGWRPRIGMEESLKNTLRYYREKQI